MTKDNSLRKIHITLIITCIMKLLFSYYLIIVLLFIRTQIRLQVIGYVNNIFYKN